MTPPAARNIDRKVKNNKTVVLYQEKVKEKNVFSLQTYLEFYVAI